MTRLGFALPVALVVIAAGCGDHADSKPTASTLRGSVNQASFPAPVGTLITRSDAGVRRRISVRADGTFTASLSQGASYELFILVGDEQVPVVLRQVGARLETMVQVRSGGASVDLGHLKFVDPGASSGLASRCVNGLDTNGLVCPKTRAASSCSSDGNDGQKGDHEGDHQDGAESDGSRVDTQVSDADAAEARGVAEFSVPPAVGCGDGERNHGEGDQQEED